jgi:hypothetical protein
LNERGTPVSEAGQADGYQVHTQPAAALTCIVDVPPTKPEFETDWQSWRKGSFWGYNPVWDDRSDFTQGAGCPE